MSQKVITHIPVHVYIVNWKCPITHQHGPTNETITECLGYMHYTGKSQPMGRPKYWHKCTFCGHKELDTQTWPHKEYVPTSEEQPKTVPDLTQHSQT